MKIWHYLHVALLLWAGSERCEAVCYRSTHRGIPSPSCYKHQSRSLQSLPNFVRWWSGIRNDPLNRITSRTVSRGLYSRFGR